MRIIGYAICGRGEARRYLVETLEEFKRLCDETIILGNNISQEERQVIKNYGFHLVEDNREWGKAQHIIKQDFVRDHVSKLDPDVTVCLDVDETLPNVTREKIEEQFTKGDAWYVYIINLWGKGWRQDWSFWNVRMWSWRLREELGEGFFRFENRPLHCGLAPKWCYALNLHAPFVLLHKGLMKKSDRQAKIDRYAKYDPNQTYRSPLYYQALADDSYQKLDLSDIIRRIEKDVSELKQPLNKKVNMPPKEDKVLILREADGFVFDVPEKQAQHYLRQEFKGRGFSILDTITDSQRTKAPIKKKKKLVYVARHNQKDVDDTEGHISRAFEELGWDVMKVQEGSTNIPEGDVLLYHKWIPPEWNGTKVCWYFDKIYFNSREDQVEKIVNASDYFFATDGDGIKRLGNPKCQVLRQGVGYDCEGGKKMKAPDIVFTGSLYGERGEWFKKLKGVKHVQGVFGEDLNDLCVSTKIMLAPDYPSTPDYWSNRVYDLTGRGGFVLHPYQKTLEEEFEGNLAMYEDELEEQIAYYLENEDEREEKRRKCTEITREKFTYKTRVEELCSKLSIKEN